MRTSRSVSSTILIIAGLVASLHVSAHAQVTPALNKSTPLAPKAASSHREDANPGPYEVVTIDLVTLHDKARNKDLEVTIRFPRLPKKQPHAPTKEHFGPFPLVVFSHGMGGSRRTFAETTAFWASHGYVVVTPTHSDSVELQRRTDKDVAGDFLKNPRAYTSRVDPADRLADAKFILDSIDTIESLPEAKAHVLRIDREHIGMAGHSAGALTTQMACGVKVRGIRGVDGDNDKRLMERLKLRSVGDDRIDVGLIISGQGTTSRMFTSESWKQIPTPILVITGSKDTSPASNETPETRKHPYVYSPGIANGGKPAYLLWINGATHSSYAGKQTSRLLGEGNVDNIDTIVRLTNATTLAMLDAYLKDNQEAKQWLDDDKIVPQTSKGKATLEHK